MPHDDRSASRPITMDTVNKAMEAFSARSVNNITDLYDYYPDPDKALLGKGSFGNTYTMIQRQTHHHQYSSSQQQSQREKPPRTYAVKHLAKHYYASRRRELFHLGAELAILQRERSSSLNHMKEICHDQDKIYLVLETTDGDSGSTLERLYYLYAHRSPQQLPRVGGLVERIDEAWEGHQQRHPEVAGDHAKEVAYYETQVAHQFDALEVREPPSRFDLFNAIVFYRRFPELKALVIAKQILEGIQALHADGVVHRDIKTENVILGEKRHITPIVDKASGQMAGVHVEETLDTQIIDFGLVKFMHVQENPQTTSPTPAMFDNAPQRATGDDDDAGGGLDFTAAAEQPGMFREGGNSGRGAGASVTPTIGMPINATPCGTDMYMAWEVVNSIVGGANRDTFTTDTNRLPKDDVWAAGTALFCMVNGRPPFRIPDQCRRLPRADRLRYLLDLMNEIPSFHRTVSPTMRQLVLFLMDRDVRRRPKADKALQHPLLVAVEGDTYCYDVDLNGNRSNETTRQRRKRPQAPPPTAAEALNAQMREQKEQNEERAAQEAVAAHDEAVFSDDASVPTEADEGADEMRQEQDDIVKAMREVDDDEDDD